VLDTRADAQLVFSDVRSGDGPDLALDVMYDVDVTG